MKRIHVRQNHPAVVTLTVAILSSVVGCRAPEKGDGASLASGVLAVDETGRWTRERAWRWYAETGVIRGCNFVPRTAVNMTEMWQAATFDSETIDAELGAAAKAGYNSIRVFVQYLVWKDDPAGLLDRFERLLATADRHGIGVAPILFCDCAFAGKQPYLGEQDEPVPGVHNSGWVPSPGFDRVVDRQVWPDLERYVIDFVTRFRDDRRVQFWDLYNEPGNSNMGEKSLPLVEAAFAWARAAKPTQPVTTGVWTALDSRMSRRILDLSDIVTFHSYGDAAQVRATIRHCRAWARPMVCTEWLRRQVGNDFATNLPIFAAYGIGAQPWGLFAGRTQTYMHWGSKEGDPLPAVWQHDVFRADGTPYDARELELLRAFDFDVPEPEDAIRASLWTEIDNGLARLTVAPGIGGRVLQYRLGDYGFFWVDEDLASTAPPASALGPDDAWLNYGGDKLWLAPQGWDTDEQWPGPPDAVLDGGPYAARWIEADDGSGRPVGVELTSAPAPESGVRLARTVRTFPGTTRVAVDATIENTSDKPRRWGIWAHTQFDAGNRHGDGYNDRFGACCPLSPDSAFPRGYDVLFGLVNNASFRRDEENGLLRVQYRRRVGKAGVDSRAGWVATVDETDGYAFVQRFEFVPDRPYPEGSSVEFWMNGVGEFVAWGKVNSMPDDPRTNPYVFESELLSPYAEIAPGERDTFHYEWFAARIPAGAAVVEANDVGVTCERLSARRDDERLALSGRFGVFYCGTARGELDVDGAAPLFDVRVSPHAPLDVASIVVEGALPAGATRLSIVLRDETGQVIGELARTSI